MLRSIIENRAIDIKTSTPNHIIKTAFGLRDAKAYVLIYDLLCPDSFDYIEGLHAQISDNRDLGSIPVIVVGNKTDKVHRNLSTSRMRNKRKEREELKKAKRGLFIVLNIDKSNIYSIYISITTYLETLYMIIIVHL